MDISYLKICIGKLQKYLILIIHFAIKLLTANKIVVFLYFNNFMNATFSNDVKYALYKTRPKFQDKK